MTNNSLLSLLSPLRWLPQPVTAVSLAITLNLFFQRYPDLKERLGALSGKIFRFEVEDLSQEFFMRVEEHGEVRIHTYSDDEVHVTMSGSSHAFLSLLFHRSDPDALFFSRALKMSGETDTGLHFKNILDNVEIDWEGELSLFLGRPLAGLLTKTTERLQQSRQQLRNHLDQRSETWLREHHWPRRHQLEQLREEGEAMAKRLDKMEHSLNRCGNRVNLAKHAKQTSSDHTLVVG
ncbi:MAG: SCP2 sterol-binding domain-containing protein [Magnetococcales bacterium]|nr:SCP2 sterol-binding domain-containing protein [Magnetococcales bacterium]